jgi:hypothetical protein
MARNRERQKITSQREGGRLSNRFSRHMRVGSAAVILVFIGLFAWTIVRQQSKPTEGLADRPSLPPTESQSNGGHTDVDLSRVVNQLFSSVSPSLPENEYFPQFAKERLLWIVTQRNAGKLSIILLKNTDNTNLYFEDLMASGIVEGKLMIVIAGPRFLDFLLEGGRTSPPFTQRQRNDFAVGLVHETIHLEKENTANPANFQERLAEEVRAWRKVDLSVVRQLRQLNQPMNPRLIEADDALRSCGDKAECESLREILFPTERTR